ncbi:hypothetical protein B0H11DRAFT_1199668 [Mycena galericulata]|nr:hypothetical protein B0H11DRAFT_1199668 [Mycena galericulata]
MSESFSICVESRNLHSRFCSATSILLACRTPGLLRLSFDVASGRSRRRTAELGLLLRFNSEWLYPLLELLRPLSFLTEVRTSGSSHLPFEGYSIIWERSAERGVISRLSSPLRMSPGIYASRYATRATSLETPRTRPETRRRRPRPANDSSRTSTSSPRSACARA